MKKFYETIARAYRIHFAEMPWVEAAGYVSFVYFMVYIIDLQLPDEYAYHDDYAKLGYISFFVLFLVYLFCVAILFQKKLHYEKKLRVQGQNFRYDRRGTLYNGEEPNIAFRIVTFKKILESIGSSVGDAAMQDAVFLSGKKAALNFAECFSNIYDLDICRFRGGDKWQNLSIDEKIFQWVDYDSSTGWGIMGSTAKGASVEISVTHYNGLYTEQGGKLFTYFLAGYCETMLTSIIERHQKGKYSDYTMAKFKEFFISTKDTITLHYHFA